MEKFIRLDMKGHWRGKEHKSSMQGMGEETYFEDGISCFNLDDQAHALENLRWYWFELASVTEKDLEGMQVTIFEGEQIGYGSEMEDIATCERTLNTFEAREFMMNIEELHDMIDDEITEEEYEEKLNEMELI